MDQPRENDQERGDEVQSKYSWLPAEFKNCIRAMFTDKPTPTHYGILLVQKLLSNRDVNPQKGRFSFPSSSLIPSPSLIEDFLLHGTSIILVEPSLQRFTLVDFMKKKKKNKNNNHSGEDRTLYVLTTSWNEVVTRNNLEAGQIVQLWAVRFYETYCLTLRRLTTEGNNASGGSDAAANTSSS